MGRIKQYREDRKRQLAEAHQEQKIAKLAKDVRNYCPVCKFQLWSAAGRMVNFCARCGYLVP